MSHLMESIILIVVVFIVFNRLKNLLGTRPENTISSEEAAKIFDIIMKETEKEKTIGAKVAELDENASETDKALSKIPHFNKDSFLNGAQKAFEMILNAFSKGDMETLEMLAHKKLVKKFQDIIEKRKAEGLISETDLIGFEASEIQDAQVNKNNVAKITVKFISEQINILKNAKQEVIEGDENYIQTITDNWTFERSITSTNPNWLLVSTKK